MLRFTDAARAQIAATRHLLSLTERCPPRWVDRLLGPPIERQGHVLDRQFQLALAIELRLRRGRTLGELPIAKSRRDMELRAAALAPEPAPLRAITDLTLDGGDGAAPVRARRYDPFGLPAPAPALLYYHGGGWAQGSLDTHEALCCELAARAACVVLAVSYRLAPEHRFPAAVEDATAALRAAHRHAARLGIDAARIALGGDSAGGNLAAVVAQQSRGQAARPCFQLLVYPALDMTMSMPSIESLGQGFFLERAGMEWYRAHYLPPGADLSDPAALQDPRFSPYHQRDLRGLPPAFVMTAGFDPLRDEGEAYARRLREAGNDVRYRCYGPLVHGFLNTTGVIRGARAALEDAIGALRGAISSAPAAAGPRAEAAAPA